MKRAIAVILTAIILVCLPATVCLAAEEDTLYVEDVVLINDTQLIIKFNQPIAINLNGDNRGPWIALRIVDNEDNYLYSDDNSFVLQWTCDTRFADENHDIILLTYDMGEEGNMLDFVNFTGYFEQFKTDDRHNRLCIEEVPFDQTVASNDGLLDNVTTTDGKILMTATKPGGWDGSYFDIRVDYDYEIDLSNTQDLKESTTQIEYGTVLSLGDLEPLPEIEVKSETPVGLICAIIGGGVIAIGAALGIIIGIKKKGGKAE